MPVDCSSSREGMLNLPNRAVRLIHESYTSGIPTALLSADRIRSH